MHELNIHFVAIMLTLLVSQLHKELRSVSDSEGLWNAVTLSGFVKPVGRFTGRDKLWPN